MCLCVCGVSSDFSEHVSVRWTWKTWPELSRGRVPWGCSVLGGVPEGRPGDSPFVPVWMLALTCAEPRPPRPWRPLQASVHPPAAPVDSPPGPELWVLALALCVGVFVGVPCR